MKLKDAFEFVKTQREKTDPNEGFMEQLRRFEEAAFNFQNEFEGQDKDAKPSCLIGPHPTHSI